MGTSSKDLEPKKAQPASSSDQMMKDAAYERIENLLNAGKLTPGKLISQRELVEMTGATLGSIREAISRLEAEGLLRALPKRGLMVPSMDVTFVRDAYELRRIIELSAIEPAIQRIPREKFSQWINLHQKSRDQKPVDEQLMADEIQELDWSMHSSIVNAMHNELVMNVYRVTAIKIRMAVQFRLQVTPFNAERIINEHLQFLLPMYEGRTEDAKIAMARHLANSLTLALGGTI